jgi:hypothetical protein
MRTATSIEKHYPVIGPLIAAAGNWVHNYRLRRQTRHDFETCDHDEVLRIATEIGISPSDLRRLASQSPDTAKLLLRRMSALHPDPGR